jgi:hypothetical protein
MTRHNWLPYELKMQKKGKKLKHETFVDKCLLRMRLRRFGWIK